jgi:hypothetical protein
MELLHIKNKDLAIWNAICELIERDAIMVNWYSKEKIYQIEGNLPTHIQDRKKIWKNKYNYTIGHCDLTLDSLPVVVTFFLNENEYPCFVAGPGCGKTYTEALEKSFKEAEFMLTSWSENKENKITIEQVEKVHDHALLYFYPDHLSELEYLTLAKTQYVDMNKVHNIDVLSKFDPVVITLKEKDFENDLCVVHLVCENLMPINFGRGLEAYKHKRFNELGLNWEREFPSLPHYFA